MISVFNRVVICLWVFCLILLGIVTFYTNKSIDEQVRQEDGVERKLDNNFQKERNKGR